MANPIIKSWLHIMANFPALIPADAIITPGAIPATVVQGYDGSTVTTTADTLATGDLLTLPFQNLSEAEANSVRAHQASQQGRPFAFDAITLAPALSQPGYAWVYASAPQQEDIRSVAGSELYFLTCAFRAVRVRVAQVPSATSRIVLRAYAARALPAGPPGATSSIRLTTTAAGVVTTPPGDRSFLVLRPTAASVVVVPPPTVFTFTASTATNVPIPDALSNPRPIQLNQAGGAMNTGVTPNSRNFIYLSLVGSNASVGNWRPVGQSDNTANRQRFDYYFDTATSSETGGVSGSATVRNWINRLDLAFGSFYLDGTAAFCGVSNAVAMLSASSTGSAQFISEALTSTVGNSVAGNQNSIASGIYPIVFGASGITGTIQFTAYTNVVTDPFSQLSGGVITITVDS